MKKIPSVKMSPLTFLKLAKADLIGLRTQLFQQYGDFFSYRIKGKTNYYIMHPKDIKHVIYDNQDNYLLRHPLLLKTFCPFTGKGFNFNNNLIEWRRDRNTAMMAIEPSLYFSDYAKTITQIMKEELVHWQQKYKNNTYININLEIGEIIIKIVTSTLFTNLYLDSREVAELIMDISNIAKIKLYTPPLLWYFSYRNKLYYQNTIKRSRLISNEIIGKRVNSHTHWDDIIGYFMHEYSNFSQNESHKLLADHLITLVAVSYFTTTALVQWILVELSLRPEEGRKILDEIDHVIGERIPQYNDLQSLPYLSAFIKEVLRLHPTFFGIMREAQDDDIIDDVEIKKNSGIIMSIYNVHRHPEFWTNPEGFDPSRFINNALGQDNAFAYIPFGAGKRGCIGSSFSTVEAKLIIIMMLKKCRLYLLPNTKIQPYITTPLSMRPDVNEMQIKWL